MTRSRSLGLVGASLITAAASLGVAQTKQSCTLPDGTCGTQTSGDGSCQFRACSGQNGCSFGEWCVNTSGDGTMTCTGGCTWASWFYIDSELECCPLSAPWGPCRPDPEACGRQRDTDDQDQDKCQEKRGPNSINVATGEVTYNPPRPDAEVPITGGSLRLQRHYDSRRAFIDAHRERWSNRAEKIVSWGAGWYHDYEHVHTVHSPPWFATYRMPSGAVDTTTSLLFTGHPGRRLALNDTNTSYDIVDYDGSKLLFEHFISIIPGVRNLSRLSGLKRDGSPTITLTWYQSSNAQANCYVPSQTDPRWGRPCLLKAGSEAFIHFTEYDRQLLSEGEPFDEEFRHALLMTVRYGAGEVTSVYTGETRYTYDIVTVLDANGLPFVDPATGLVRKRRLLSKVSYWRKVGANWLLADEQSYTYTNQSYVRADLGPDPATNPYTTATTISSMHDGFKVLGVELLSRILHRDNSFREAYSYDKYGRGAASLSPGEALLVRYVPLSATSDRILVTDESSGKTTEYQATNVAAAGEPRQMRLTNIGADCGCAAPTASFERDAGGFVVAKRDLPATGAGVGMRTALALDARKRVTWRVENWEGPLPADPASIDPYARPSRLERLDYVEFVPTVPSVESRVRSVICGNAASWGFICTPGTYAMAPALVRDFDLVEAGAYNDAIPPAGTSTLPQREVSIGYQLTNISTGSVGEVRKVRRYGYATAAGPLTSVEEGGITTTYEYYPATDPAVLNRNRPWKVSRGATVLEVDSAFPRPSLFGATVLQTFSEYDSHGNAGLVVDNLTGVARARSFDAAGRLSSDTISASGFSRNTSYVYNGRGGVDRVVASSVPSAPQGVVSYQYVLPAGLAPPDAATFCAMDTSTAVSACLDALGYLDRPTQIDTGGGVGGVLTRLYSREQPAYDRQGRATSLSTNDGTTLERYRKQQFDSMGRLLRQLKFTSSTAAPAAVRDVYYDLLGRMSKVADENHALVTASRSENDARANKIYAYDPLGRLQTVTEGSGATVRVTTYGYDAHDNLTTVVDPDGRTTSYLYDDFGQLTGVDSRDSGVTLYQYDALGNLVAKLEPGTPAVRTAYAYDGLGRLNEERVFENGLQVDATVYGYNSLAGSAVPAAPVSATCPDGPRSFDPQSLGGRLAWVRHATGTTYYSYHPLGEVTAVFEQHGPTFSICNVTIVRYSFDGLGRLTSLTYPSGRVVTYVYASDAARPTSVTVSGPGLSTAVTLFSSIGYDVDGAVDAMAGGSFSLSATRDYAGQALRRLYGWGSASRFDWRVDLRDQVGNIRQVKDASSLRELNVGYDDAYRVTSVVGTALRGHQACSYTYDKAGNRTREDCYNRPITYVYSPAGAPLDNKLRELTWTTGVTCGPPELAKRQTQPDARGRQTVGYLRKYPQARDAFAMGYDARGRVDQVTVGPNVYFYSYDHRNLRLRKDGPGGSTLYAFDTSGRILAEQAGSEAGEYVWLNGEPVGLVKAGGSLARVYILGVDHLGTPMRAWDSQTGLTAWAADYEAFGRATTYVPGSTAAPQVEVNLRFPGQIYDQETGLHYNWHRYYSPDTGRYLQTDPMATSRPGWSQPIYSYALNNPLRFTDSTGLVVRLCKRIADLPGNGLVGVTHQWIVTNSGSGGMGACGAGVPGHGQVDSPYATDTCNNDHANEPLTGPGVTCEFIYDADEDCVNAALLKCRELGKWSAWNQCQSYAADVLKQCRKNTNKCPQE